MTKFTIERQIVATMGESNDPCLLDLIEFDPSHPDHYTNAHGWDGDGWNTYSEPGDAFLELVAGRLTLVALYVNSTGVEEVVVFYPADE